MKKRCYKNEFLILCFPETSKETRNVFFRGKIFIYGWKEKKKTWQPLIAQTRRAMIKIILKCGEASIPNINSETNPPLPVINVVLQVSETVSWHKLRCCYSANILQHWVLGRDLIYFFKVDHSRISRNFSGNWVGLNNLCEILMVENREILHKAIYTNLHERKLLSPNLDLFMLKIYSHCC